VLELPGTLSLPESRTPRSAPVPHDALRPPAPHATRSARPLLDVPRLPCYVASSVSLEHPVHSI
jgi:hypothetical protein